MKHTPRKRARGFKKGAPLRERFLRYTSMVGGDWECWQWTGARRGPKAYGVLRLRADESANGRTYPEYAHRIAYRLFVGPLSADRHMHLDHLCRNTGCVNPTHLEPVTASENRRRGLQAIRNGLAW